MLVQLIDNHVAILQLLMLCFARTNLIGRKQNLKANEISATSSKRKLVSSKQATCPGENFKILKKTCTNFLIFSFWCMKESNWHVSKTISKFFFKSF